MFLHLLPDRVKLTGATNGNYYRNLRKLVRRKKKYYSHLRPQLTELKLDHTLSCWWAEHYHKIFRHQTSMKFLKQRLPPPPPPFKDQSWNF
jgi:hypothetical protein